MNFKPLIPALFLSAALIAGCSTGPVTVTEENAPNELLKSIAALSSESEASDVQEVFQTLIDTTVQAYDYQMLLKVTSTSTNLEYDDDNNLTGSDSTIEYYDIRCAADDVYYELLEQLSDDTTTVGAMKFSATETSYAYSDTDATTLGTTDSTMTITSVQTQTGEESTDDMAAVVQNTVVYPLYSYFGQSLIVQPATNPEYYDFSFVKKAGSYVLTVSVKDLDAYNEYVDQYVEETYGVERTDLNGDGSYVVDVNRTAKIAITLTMDENGVISKISNESTDEIGSEDDLIDFYANQDVTLTKMDDTYKTFFPNFFGLITNGDYVEGTEYTIADVAAKTDVKGVDLSSVTSSDDDSSEESTEKESDSADSDKKSETDEKTADDSSEEKTDETKTEETEKTDSESEFETESSDSK
jgi:hypothetical protein